MGDLSGPHKSGTKCVLSNCCVPDTIGTGGCGGDSEKQTCVHGVHDLVMLEENMSTHGNTCQAVCL
jgi:hypothetical protein